MIVLNGKLIFIPQHGQTQNGLQWSFSSSEWSCSNEISWLVSSQVCPSLHGIIVIVSISKANMTDRYFICSTNIVTFYYNYVAIYICYFDWVFLIWFFLFACTGQLNTQQMAYIFLSNTPKADSRILGLEALYL